MDTLSTSVVSTLRIPSLLPTSTNHREFHHHFSRTHPHATTSNILPQKTKTPPNTISTFPSQPPPFSSSKTTPLFKLKLPSPPTTFHHNPATGYAAAIIDVAQNTNSLHSVQRDVDRLLKFLQRVKLIQSNGNGVVDPSMLEDIKREALRKMVMEQRGNLDGHVTALVKMLMRKKKKMGIIEQVMEEFERLYDELCGTQVVLVSSPNRNRNRNRNRIGKDEILKVYTN